MYNVIYHNVLTPSRMDNMDSCFKGLKGKSLNFMDFVYQDFLTL